ncbi:ATP-grasp domain-containing protein [Halobacillus rhizosphaerae]|uniref:ATP-grasp domain-containing protein n=1 Tax=Halobacillus rhizosphaerae TaxID=3064889 RepID=UPI00398AA900
MSHKTVFLTGAGGAAVPGLIRILKSKGYRVLAGDMDPHAVGLYTADQGFKLPQGDSPEFSKKLAELCQQEKVDVLIPLVDEELPASAALGSESLAVLVPDKTFIELCLDKYKLMQAFEKAGIPFPRTKLASEGAHDLKFPIIAKPRVGRGSRGVEVFQSIDEFNSYRGTLPSAKDILIQEYIDGLEFTVSVCVWRDGRVQAVIPKEIIKKRGVTQLAVTRKNSVIEKVCIKIQEQLQADGPFNVQLRIDKQGVPFVFEINPRFSTSVSLTIASGFDELNYLVDRALGVRSSQNISWKEGVVLLRQTLDEFITEDKFLKRMKEFTGEGQ